MTPDDLGEMSTDEVMAALRTAEVTKWPALTEEADERWYAYHSGASDRHAVLSVAQARAFLGPLMGRLGGPSIRVSIGNEIAVEAPEWDVAIEAAARALLNLGPAEPSPLED